MTAISHNIIKFLHGTSHMSVHFTHHGCWSHFSHHGCCLNTLYGIFYSCHCPTVEPSLGLRLAGSNHTQEKNSELISSMNICTASKVLMAVESQPSKLSPGPRQVLYSRRLLKIQKVYSVSSDNKRSIEPCKKCCKNAAIDPHMEMIQQMLQNTSCNQASGSEPGSVQAAPSVMQLLKD